MAMHDFSEDSDKYTTSYGGMFSISKSLTPGKPELKEKEKEKGQTHRKTVLKNTIARVRFSIRTHNGLHGSANSSSAGSAEGDCNRCKASDQCTTIKLSCGRKIVLCMPCAELFLEWMQAETQSLSEVSFKHCNTVFMCPWIQESKTNASDVDRKRLPKLRRDSEGDERRYGSSEPSSTEAENKIGVALRKTALDDVQIPHAREQRSGLQPVKISNLQEKIPTPARQRRAASVDLSTPPQLYKFQENLQGKLRPSSQIDFHEICKDLECRNSPEPGMAKEEWSHHRDARSRRSHQLHSSQPRRHSEYGLIVEKGRTEVLMGRSSPKSDSKVRRSKIINESYLEDFHNRRESAARAAAQSSDTTYRSKLIFHTKAQSRLREALFQSN